MPHDRSAPTRPTLDPGARVILGQKLREYYERMRQTAVSDSLAQLLRQFEAAAVPESVQSATPHPGS
jgi:hypothetical protein